MRSERFKMIQSMIENNSFRVIDRRRVGDTEYIEVRIEDSMFFQLTQDEVIDGINGYMCSAQMVTEVKPGPVVDHFATLNITMKDVNYVRPKSR